MQESIKLIYEYLVTNWTWLLPWVFGLISLIAILFKKGSVNASDIAKITATQKVIATALSVILEKEKKNEKTQSEKERTEV